MIYVENNCNDNIIDYCNYYFSNKQDEKILYQCSFYKKPTLFTEYVICNNNKNSNDICPGIIVVMIMSKVYARNVENLIFLNNEVKYLS